MYCSYSCCLFWQDRGKHDFGRWTTWWAEKCVQDYPTVTSTSPVAAGHRHWRQWSCFLLPSPSRTVEHASVCLTITFEMPFLEANAFSGGKCEVQGSMIGLDFWKHLKHCWHCMRAVESSVKAIHCERVRVIPMYPQKDEQFLLLARQEGWADKKGGWKCFKVASGWSGTNDDFKTLAHLHPLLPQNLKGRFLFCCWWNFA